MANNKKIKTKKLARISYESIVKDDNPILREVSKEVE